jgi:hypothetical protein
MHGTSGYISAFESSKTAQDRRRHHQSKIDPETFSVYFAIRLCATGFPSDDHRRRLPAPNRTQPLQSNLPTALLLNLFGFIQKGVQIHRDSHFKIRAGLHLQQLHLSPLQRGCLNFQLTAAHHLTWFPTCF